MSLSPPQERVAEEISRHAQEAPSNGPGQVLFVGGEPGSGRSHLLRVAAKRLEKVGGVRVATGGLASDTSISEPPEWTEKAGSLFAGAAAVASALNPALALIEAIAEFSAAAADVLRAPVRDPADAELVTRVLRAAAREAPGRPLVCLVDDASWLNGAWWTELQFSFAKEIAQELSLLLVLAIDDPPPSVAQPDEHELPPPHRVRQSLAARGLATVTSLGRLTSYELREWLGPAPRPLVQGTLDLTGGRSGEVIELWRTWLTDGVLVETDNEEWKLEGTEEALTGDALTKLAKLIESALPEANLADEETIREALALGALEGRTFTAAAVADAIGRDRDEVEDLLDELVETPGQGILRPPRPLEVRDLRQSRSWTLWRYEFSSRLLWRAVLGRLSDFSAKEAAQRLLDSLAKAYEHEIPAISPVMARLADLCDQAASAGYYRSLVTAPSDAVLSAQAQRLMGIDSANWTFADHRDAASVLAEAALRLSFVTDCRGLLPLVERAVGHAEQAAQGGYRVMGFVLAVKGSLFLRLGELDLAEESLEDARAILAVGDPSGLANVLRLLAEVIADREQGTKRQKSLLETSLSLYRRLKDAKGEATVQYNLAGIAIFEKDFARARALNARALATMRASRDREQEMTILMQRANIEQRSGNFDLARGLAEELLRFYASTGRTRAEATCLTLLARTEWRSGNLEEAKVTGETALALHRKLENQVGETGALHVLGDVALSLGEADESRELLQQTKENLERIGDKRQLSRVEDKLDQLSEPAG